MWADVNLAIRAGIVLVFAAAVAGKLRNRAAFLSFAESVRAVTSASGARSKILASAVIGAECGVVVLTGLGATAIPGFALSALLLGLFVVGIARVLATGTLVRCRCFGRLGAPLWRGHVVRNALLGLCALIGIYAHLEGESERLTLTQSFAPVAVGLVVGMAFIAWDDFSFLLVGDRRVTWAIPRERR